MTCKGCCEQASGLVRSELPAQVVAEVRAHVAECVACKRFLDETRAMHSLLSRAENDALPPDFSVSLHRKLVASPAPAAPGFLASLRAFFVDRPFARPVLTVAFSAAFGAAALMAVVAARGEFAGLRLGRSLSGGLATAGDVEPIFVVPRTKVAVVRIDFLAEQDIADVEFAIALPEGLHFVSEGRELPDREFRWHGRLDRGSNPIPVAVRGARAGRYTLDARAVSIDMHASQRVVLEVTSS